MMSNKKISIPRKITSEIQKYPMVAVEWYDIVSDSSWTSFEACKKAKLATCITKGHLLSQAKVLLEYLEIIHMPRIKKILIVLEIQLLYLTQ